MYISISWIMNHFAKLQSSFCIVFLSILSWRTSWLRPWLSSYCSQVLNMVSEQRLIDLSFVHGWVLFWVSSLFSFPFPCRVIHNNFCCVHQWLSKIIHPHMRELTHLEVILIVLCMCIPRIIQGWCLSLFSLIQQDIDLGEEVSWGLC